MNTYDETYDEIIKTASQIHDWDTPPQGTIILSADTASQCIKHLLREIKPASDNPMKIRLCMEDARTPGQVYMIAEWCGRFKSLEGKKITSVTWEQDSEKSYIRNLVIQTE